jgi:hypothetical protein
MLETYKVRTCLESNPKFWCSFLIWYNKWNDTKLNPTEWTEGMCHEFLMEWQHTVLDRLNIDYKEIK